MDCRGLRETTEMVTGHGAGLRPTIVSNSQAGQVSVRRAIVCCEVRTEIAHRGHRLANYHGHYLQAGREANLENRLRPR